MRAAIIGAGDIARKAYLPLLCADPTLEPVLVTRDPAVRARVSAAHRLGASFETTGQALESGLDVAFVHAATVAHAQVVAQLLDAGVHVYVDKPLDDTAAGAAALAQRARAAGLSLAVGFNRRHAPEYVAVHDWAERDTVVMHKHRYGAPSPRVTGPASQPVSAADSDRTLVFDDLVHVLDTLRFLGAEGRDGLDVSARRRPDGSLGRVEVQLRDGARRATGVMDRDSGATVEELDVLGPGRRVRVRDLATVEESAGGSVTVRHRDEWVPVGRQRGFEGAVGAFLAAVRDGRALDAADAVRTHELCESVVGALAAEGTR